MRRKGSERRRAVIEQKVESREGKKEARAMPEIQLPAPAPDLRGLGGRMRARPGARGGSRGGLRGREAISGSVTCAGAVLFSVLFLQVLLPFNLFPFPRSSSFTLFEMI